MVVKLRTERRNGVGEPALQPSRVLDEPVRLDPPAHPSSKPSRPPRQKKPAGRSLAQRISRGHVFGLVLGLIGFALTWSMVDDRNRTVEILVVEADIAAGSEIDPSNLTNLAVPVDSVLVQRGIPSTDGRTLHAVENLAVGDPVLASSVTDEPLRDGLVEVEVEVTSTSGDIKIGDQVGVIGVVSQGSRSTSGWLSVDARVVAIADQIGGGLVTSLERRRITLAVSGSQALALVGAQDVGELALVRSGFDAETIDVEERIVVTPDVVGRQTDAPGGSGEERSDG